MKLLAVVERILAIGSKGFQRSWSLHPSGSPLHPSRPGWCDSRRLGFCEHACVCGKAGPAGAERSVGEGKGVLAGGKDRAGRRRPAALNPSPGNASDIFLPLVSGQQGIYGPTIPRDDLGGAELCVTPDGCCLFSSWEATAGALPSMSAPV